MRRDRILPQTASSDYATGAWHLEQRAVCDVQIEMHQMVQSPGRYPDQWRAVAARPPSLPGQSVRHAEFRVYTRGGTVPGQLVREPDGLQRPLFQLAVSSRDSLYAQAFVALSRFQATLYCRHLTPGAPRRSGALAPALKALYTQRTPRLDARTPQIEGWIAARKLARGPRERPLPYAWRLATALRQDFNFTFTSSDDPSAVCAARRGDSEGLGALLVSVLRRFGVPARLTVGFWADTNQRDAGQKAYTRLEFYDGGVGGWVPLDAAGLIRWGESWAAAFGNDEGNFFVLHEDLDLRVPGEDASLPELRFPMVWVTGGDSRLQPECTVTWTIQRTRPGSR